MGKWNVYDIENRWLRGLAAWAIYVPSALIFAGCIIAAALHEAVVAGAYEARRQAAQTFGKTWNSSLRRALAFRKDA